MERKTLEFKVTNLDFEGRTVEGHAAAFGNLDLGGDIIHPGAFTKTLAERGGKVRFLWQHDPKEPLGRPVEMHEDSHGLFVKAIISPTIRGNDALALLRDNAIDGLSIGYDAVKGATDFSKQDDGTTVVRNLREIKLYELSLVTFPMNEGAMVTALKEGSPAGAGRPSEQKPAPEVTENTIRIRVRDSGDFQEGSLRVIPIDEQRGIQATIGRLTGETTTTVQGYIFDKDKWTVEEAQKWVDEHEKGIDAVFELKIGRVLARRNADRITQALAQLHDVLADAGLLESEPEETPEEAPEDEGKSAPVLQAGPDIPPTYATERERLQLLLAIEQII